MSKKPEETPVVNRSSEPTTLTHDLNRAVPGAPWHCVNCGKEGATIGAVNATPCPNVPTSNENVIAAIAGKGAFAPRPSEPTPSPDEHRGLYGKYRVERRDGSSGPGGKHEHCDYFVLDIEHDRNAFPALLAYASACQEKHPLLAADLRRRAVGEKAGEVQRPNEARPGGGSRATMPGERPKNYALTCEGCAVLSPIVCEEDVVVDAAIDAGWMTEGTNEDDRDACPTCRSEANREATTNGVSNLRQSSKGRRDRQSQGAVQGLRELPDPVATGDQSDPDHRRRDPDPAEALRRYDAIADRALEDVVAHMREHRDWALAPGRMTIAEAKAIEGTLDTMIQFANQRRRGPAPAEKESLPGNVHCSDTPTKESGK